MDCWFTKVEDGLKERSRRRICFGTGEQREDEFSQWGRKKGPGRTHDVDVQLGYEEEGTSSERREKSWRMSMESVAIKSGSCFTSDDDQSSQISETTSTFK